MNAETHILIVDDDRRMARTLVDILKIKGYCAEEAHSVNEALKKARNRTFDCILTDIKMPGMNGVELFRAIKSSQPQIPVVMMTAYANDKLVEEGLNEGAVASLTKPLDINLLLNFFSSLRREQLVVIVDDDSAFCKSLGDILRIRRYSVFETSNPDELIDMTKDGVCGVVLLDMKLDGADGLGVLQQIREYDLQLPVILVTGYREEMTSSIEAALKLNAYACLYKPLQIEELIQVLIGIQHQMLGKILGRDPDK